MKNKLYTELLRTGDLFEMFENMTGDWQEDEISFIEQQTALESFTNNIEINGEYE